MAKKCVNPVALITRHPQVPCQQTPPFPELRSSLAGARPCVLTPAHAGHRNPLKRRFFMAEKEQPKQPTHRAYSVIRREGQDDFWLNLGLVFAHKDGKGFNIMLQAFPLDGKLVCREVGEDDENSKGSQEPERAAP